MAFRILVVAVLALAIPAHGMASVMAGQCMALEHHQDGDSHPHDASGDAHSHGDDAGQADEGQKSAHCGPCAACCASASITGPAALAIGGLLSSAEYRFSQFPPLGLQPHEFERPPLSG